MRHTRNFRPPFLDAVAIRRGAGRKQAYVDASCDFVVARDMKVEGVPVAVGSPFDKSRVGSRRLRQLYEGRTIALAPGSSPVVPAHRPLAVGPTDNHNPGRALPPQKKTLRRVTRRIVGQEAQTLHP